MRSVGGRGGDQGVMGSDGDPDVTGAIRGRGVDQRSGERWRAAGKG